MKTRNLTWDQAHNLLRCGLAQFIGHEKQYLNTYFLENGKIMNQYRTNGATEDDSEHLRAYDREGFKVVPDIVMEGP